VKSPAFPPVGDARCPVEDRLAAALAIDRDVRLRAASEVHPIPEGFVIRDPGLARVHYLNALLLSMPLSPKLNAQAIADLADRWLGDLDHRHVTIDDAPAADRLVPALADRGFERARTLFMAFAGNPADALPDARVREISDAELRALQLASYEREHRSPRAVGLATQLADAQVAARAGTWARGFAAGEGGGLQSNCTLFLDPDGPGGRVAMVEEVGTLSEYRERGLATAVVSAAIRAAGEWGADVIVVPADADDWPQLLYAKLGFVPIGKQVSLTRRLGPERGSERGAV
jgi:GNAT superfamily N-acetyltransferase